MNNTFETIGINKGKLCRVDAPKAKPKRSKPVATPPVVMPMCLQAHNGYYWKVVRIDGKLVLSKASKVGRGKTLSAFLRDGGFVAQLKKQIFGDRVVGDKEFFATRMRWRAINMCSFAGGDV